MHRLIAQNVLELLRGAGHLVATPHGQDLGEAAVEEDTFQYAVVGDQVLQQGLVRVNGAGGEAWIVDLLRVLESPRGFFCHRGDFVVHVEDLALVHAKGFNTVLIGVGVNGFFKCLAQQVLAALRVGDQPIDGQYQVIGDQRVCG